MSPFRYEEVTMGHEDSFSLDVFMECPELISMSISGAIWHGADSPPQEAHRTRCSVVRTRQGHSPTSAGIWFSMLDPAR